MSSCAAENKNRAKNNDIIKGVLVQGKKNLNKNVWSKKITAFSHLFLDDDPHTDSAAGEEKEKAVWTEPPGPAWSQVQGHDHLPSGEKDGLQQKDILDQPGKKQGLLCAEWPQVCLYMVCAINST